MAGYRVTAEQLVQCDAALADAAGHARAALAQLSGRAAELLGTGWQGAAAEAFGRGWQHWLDGVSTMLDALDTMAAAVGSAGAGYAVTDDGVRVASARAAS